MSGKCQNCGSRATTTRWIGNGCSVCAARQGYNNLPWWCELCTVRAQVAYMTEMADKLPELEKRLKALEEPTDATT